MPFVSKVLRNLCEIRRTRKAHCPDNSDSVDRFGCSVLRTISIMLAIYDYFWCTIDRTLGNAIGF